MSEERANGEYPPLSCCLPEVELLRAAVTMVERAGKIISDRNTEHRAIWPGGPWIYDILRAAADLEQTADLIEEADNDKHDGRL